MVRGQPNPLSPQLVAEWHPTKNGDLAPDQVTAGSSKKVWWQKSDCPDRRATDPPHDWEAVIANRSRGSGCGVCAGKIIQVGINDLGSRNPDLAAEWHPTKNGALTPDQVTAGSSKKVWWRKSDCEIRRDEDPPHEWEAVIVSRTQGNGCNVCRGKVVQSGANDLGSRYPDLAAEWHPTKNGALTPDQVTTGSNREVWWQCLNDPTHEWEANLTLRCVRDRGCPICRSGWNQRKLANFVRNLQDDLASLTRAELYALFMQNGMLVNPTTRTVAQHIIEEGTSAAELRGLLTELGETSQSDESATGGVDDSLLTGDTEIGEVEPEAEPPSEDDDAEPELPEVNVHGVLKATEFLLADITDEDTVEFFIASGVAKLWNSAYENELNVLEETSEPRENTNSEIVRSRFREQYDEARAIQLPHDWGFRPHGADEETVEPNLMQRHVAATVKRNRRVGNWSAPGSGKTVSAILASLNVGSKLTVVCCPNAVVNGWAEAVVEVCPDARIQTKTLAPEWQQGSGSRWLIVNYETFQQATCEDALVAFTDAHEVDMVVVDEVHFAKQRTETMSKRRRLVDQLIKDASAKNPDLAVLGMSATPIINSLTEGKSLVELVTGEECPLPVRPTVTNAMAMHQRLVTLGSRSVPKYSQHVTVTHPDIELSEATLERLREVSRSGPMAIEKILTESRLDTIAANLAPKTLIYTHYLGGSKSENRNQAGIVQLIKERVEQEGYSVGLYTGEDKTGLKGFLGEGVDVLIGTSTIGTGIDGLQRVCQNLIINSLPWTHAEYQQLLGRIVRQGQRASTINVIIPRTYAVVSGETWSWCDGRWSRIKWKKSLADAAVDGIVPEANLVSEAKASEALMKWLERLESAGGNS